MLPESQYQRLLACTSTRNHMIEELHILMVRTEVELQHVCRVLADASQASNPNHDHTIYYMIRLSTLYNTSETFADNTTQPCWNKMIVRNYNPSTDVD